MLLLSEWCIYEWKLNYDTYYFYDEGDVIVGDTWLILTKLWWTLKIGKYI